MFIWKQKLLHNYQNCAEFLSYFLFLISIACQNLHMEVPAEDSFFCVNALELAKVALLMFLQLSFHQPFK